MMSIPLTNLRAQTLTAALCCVAGISVYWTLNSSAWLVHFLFDNHASITVAQQKMALATMLGVACILFSLVSAIRRYSRLAAKELLARLVLASAPLIAGIKWLTIAQIELTAPWMTLLILALLLVLLGWVLGALQGRRTPVEKTPGTPVEKTSSAPVEKTPSNTAQAQTLPNGTQIVTPPRTSCDPNLLPVMLGVALLYSCVMGWLTVRRYQSFNARYFDLTIYHNLVWNSSQGRLLALTPPFNHHLPYHCDPIMLLFAPCYWLTPTPLILLVSQTLLIAAAAVLLFLIARKVLQCEYLSLALATSLLLHPATQGANWYDMHSLTLSLFTILLWLYMLQQQKSKGLWWTFLLLLLTREDMPLVAMSVGLLLIFERGEYKRGLRVVVTSLLYFCAVMAIIALYGEHEGPKRFKELLASDGHGLSSVVLTCLTNPFYTLTVLLQTPKLLFWVQMSLPVLFLFVYCRWAACLAIYPLVLHGLTVRPAQYSLYMHYPACTLALMYYATVLGIRNFLATRGQRPFSEARLALLILAASVGMWYCYGKLSPKRHPWTELTVTSVKQRVQEILAQIPSDKSVASQEPLAPQLSTRRVIYRYPDHVASADYVVLNPYFDLYPLTVKEYYQRLQHLLTRGNYGVYYYEHDYLILARGLERGYNAQVLKDIACGGSNVLHPGRGVHITTSPLLRRIGAGACARGVYVLAAQEPTFVEVRLPRTCAVDSLYIKRAGSDVTTENLAISILYADEAGHWLPLTELREVNIGMGYSSRHRLPLPTITPYCQRFSPLRVRGLRVNFQGHGSFILADLRLHACQPPLTIVPPNQRR